MVATPLPRRSWLAHLSAGLGLCALVAVLCFHFPEQLTSREIRALYSEAFARQLLLAGLVAAFVLGTLAVLRGRDRRVAMVGVGSATLAVLLGEPVHARVLRRGYDQTGLPLARRQPQIRHRLQRLPTDRVLPLWPLRVCFLLFLPIPW